MRDEAIAATPAGAQHRREADLVEQARAGSADAWTQIYSAHYPPVYRYIRARVFDDHTAEDLASAVFVAAIDSIHSYRDKGRPLLAWLYRIARNTVASHQRKVLGTAGGRLAVPLQIGRRLLGKPSTAAEDEQQLPGSDDGDPSRIAENLDLKHALQKLPQAQREVLVLRFFVGLSTEEIAHVMGKRPTAVYSLHPRAIVSLREHLK